MTKRALFVAATLTIGVLVQIVLMRYLSLYDAAPQILLLLAIAHGFMCGPITGEVLGLGWGLMSDATGVKLFGANMFLMALAGYLAGKFRRRVASERPTAQLVVGLVATLYYAVGLSNLYKFFDESGGRTSLLHLFLEAIYNVLFVMLAFYGTERWLHLWNFEQEHI